MDHIDVLDSRWQGDKAAHAIGLTCLRSDGADLVIAHNAFVARGAGRDPVRRSKLYACRRSRRHGYWRAVHHQLVGVRTVCVTNTGIVVNQINAAAVRRIAVSRIPLAVNDRVGHARITASEADATI